MPNLGPRRKPYPPALAMLSAAPVTYHSMPVKLHIHDRAIGLEEKPNAGVGPDAQPVSMPSRDRPLGRARALGY